MVNGIHALPKLIELEIEGWSRAAAPKGSMTYAFTHMGDFLLLLLLLLLHASPSNPSLEAQIPVSRPKSQLQGPNLSLKVQILAWRLKYGPQGWDLELQARIWALRLGFGP